ncbi:hypothetical protein DNU06_16250 [Putridiphycobacter roseus]|uniref:DUF7948 domain-containing protein n=1 Tax=Putridiphycobacter roseus TaxID=2219161 RepID=A0A2W1N9W9_9FLAO|nr:T9SS type B sorting domain-containing protein [Putridiphycobacter roseus]PZE15823.1 hypothetical protein DNU06_16250 [Putridiphycobacter roseus]
MKRILLAFAIALSINVLTAQEVEQLVGDYKFVENKGQWPSKALYKADVSFGNVWLEQTGILYQFIDADDIHHADFSAKTVENPQIREQYLYLQFLGCQPNAQTSSRNKTSEYYNYFIGNNQDRWARECYGYYDISYHDLYPGVDARIFEKNRQLKYEFKVAPQGDPNNIQLKYNGQESIKILKDGRLKIKTGLGDIFEEKPVAYQIKNGKIIDVPCQFKLMDGVLSFDLGKYDKDIALVIDPVLVFATYCGSVSDNFGMTATYAYDGKAYSGGTVYGNAYPTPALVWNSTTNITVPNVSNSITTDVFISKYSADGTTMLWTNFIGGGDNTQGTETVHSLICDAANNIYLYGATSSTDFPMMNAYQNTHGGGSTFSVQFNGSNFGSVGTDIFVSKISADGLNLLGSTYMGGSANDGVNYKVTSGNYSTVAAYDSLTSNYGDQFRGEIMLDAANNVLVTSSSRSINFPVHNAFQANNAGQQDGVVFKLSADFSSLMWSSYYGGSQNDACYSVKIDSSYNVLIAGGSSSSDLPNTVGGLNPNYMGGKTDGFVAKIMGDGSSVIQSTYIGTAAYDQSIFVEIDRDDNVYLVGVSDGAMPVVNAGYSNANSGQFIMKLNPSLTSIDYATIFGNGNGQPNISPAAFLVDVCGNVYVSGWGANILQGTGLNGMPVTANAEQGTNGDGFNFYLFVLERNAANILYGSYLGGALSQEHVDGGTSRFDKYGVVYQSVCGGCGGNSDFPTTTNAWSANNLSSNCNNLVFKFDFQIVPDADFTVSELLGCAPLTINFTNQSTDPNGSVWDLDAGGTIIQAGSNPIVLYDQPGQYEAILYITDTICNLTDTAKKIITVYPEVKLSLPNDTIICDADITSLDLLANSFGTATTFIWDDNDDFSSPLNAGGLDSVITVSPVNTVTFYCKVSNGNALCDQTGSVTIQFSSGIIDVMADANICAGNNVNLQATFPSGLNITADWSPKDYITYESPTTGLAKANPPKTQYYYVTANINGCIFYDSVWVKVDQLPSDSVYIIATQIEVVDGGTTILSAMPNQPYYHYLWSPAARVEQPNNQTTKTYSITDDTEFTVQVTNDACTKTAKVLIKVLEFICGDVYVFVPSAFTPDSDNVNDQVFVRGYNIEEMNFMIFDRWGEVVFETQNQNEGWDGIFRGKPLDPDVYVYHLQVKCVDGQENLIKGNITLIK